MLSKLPHLKEFVQWHNCKPVSNYYRMYTKVLIIVILLWLPSHSCSLGEQHWKPGNRSFVPMPPTTTWLVRLKELDIKAMLTQSEISLVCTIYTLRFLAWVHACVRSRKFNRKQFDLYKTLRFLCTEEAGHTFGESANRTAGALTSDKAWGVCKPTQRKGDRRRS